MPSRRTVLVTGAASAIIIGGGIFAYDVSTPSLSEAREPWRAASEGLGDPRLDILAYAILAPNPHNMQPWLIELISDDRLRVHVERERLLPETDPPNRQITIGFGAFLELLGMAAAEKGYRAEVEPFPQGEPQPVLDGRPIADFRLVADKSVRRDPLFDAVLDRRTNREAYDMARPVSDEDLAALVAAADRDAGIDFAGTSHRDRTSVLRDIAMRGWMIEYRNPATHAESNRLTRIGAEEINASPDGIALDGPMVEAASNIGMLSRAKLADPDSYAYQEGIALYSALIEASPSFGWLVSHANSRLDQLATGAAWLRVHLRATQLGLSLQPLSQVLQEFREMRELRSEIHAVLGVEPPSIVQGLFRLGRGPDQPPAPRWPLTSRLVEA